MTHLASGSTGRTAVAVWEGRANQGKRREYAGAVPHPDYQHRSGILIACSGPAETTGGEAGPAGAFASKSQADLSYAIADVEKIASIFHAPPRIGGECLQEKILLREATRDDVLRAIIEASNQLNAHNDHSTGGTLDVFFSGHGYPNGDLCLADGPLSPDELADAWTKGNTSGQRRHVRLVLDCCYAGMTLARLCLHPGHGASYMMRDAWAACLPSEEAFELPRLGHGVLTYTHTRPHLLEIMMRCQEEGRQPTEEEIRVASRANRETPHYLTNGRQHALDLINGHAVHVVGGHRDASLELFGRDWSLEELAAALDGLPKRREG